MAQELVSEGQDEESRSRIFEILERNRFEESDVVDSDDEEDVADLGERLNGIDLDDADKVWEKLTHDERQEFMAFLKSEDVAKFVPKWTPWWEFHSDKKVQEVEEAMRYKEKCPEIVSMIKDFNTISVCFSFVFFSIIYFCFCRINLQLIVLLTI